MQHVLMRMKHVCMGQKKGLQESQVSSNKPKSVRHQLPAPCIRTDPKHMGRAVPAEAAPLAYWKWEWEGGEGMGLGG